jgi:prepilin-type N-terminal cleavage/methylation domain-containing protein
MKTSRNNFQSSRGFTLIELLVVIAIIAILAALLFPAGQKIMQSAAKKRAQAELSRVASAIDSYKLKLGYYPQDNQAFPDRNLLYYELVGCRRGNGGVFAPLDNSATINFAPPRAAFYAATGIMNSSAGADADEGTVAQQFLREVQAAHFAVDGNGFRRLGVAIDGPSAAMVGNISPFRYNSSNPTNNANTFDLWVDIVVGGKTNRISNWSDKPQVL